MILVNNYTHLYTTTVKTCHSIQRAHKKLEVRTITGFKSYILLITLPIKASTRVKYKKP